jgi:hypothetical protein
MSQPSAKPGRLRSRRPSSTVLVAEITAAASVLVAIIGVVGGILAAHPQQTDSSSPTVIGVQSAASCPVVAEQYRAELHLYPAMMKALVLITATDPDARRCGIDSWALRLMMGN